MSYSSDLHTRYIDPSTYIENLRCIFRFDKGKMYLPNLKVGNLGISSTLATDEYAHIAGAYSIIRSMELRDGGQVLDRLDKANLYLSFLNRNNTNQYNYSVNSSLSKSDVGYRLTKQDRVLPNPLVNRQVCGANAVTFFNRDENGLSMIDLRVCFPLLSNLQVLDTDVFKNLSVHIEFENDVKKLLSTTHNGRHYRTQRPLMIIDEVIDESFKQELKRNNKGALWSSIESDVVQVPDAPFTTNPAHGGGIDEKIQKTSSRLNAFDNKYVSKMLILKTLSDETKDYHQNTPVGFGKFASHGMFRENLNVSLDGAQLFADGIDSWGFQQKLLENAWGQVNVSPFECARTPPGNNNNSKNAFENNYGSEQNPGAGVASTKFAEANYYGFKTENRSSQMILNYERTNVNSLHRTAFGVIDVKADMNMNGLDLVVFGMVSKSLVINADNSYVVSYN